jgi:phosphate transport system protein
MREHFRQSLDAVATHLVEMGVTAAKMIEGAGTALLAADREIAEEVVSRDATMNTAQNEADHQLLELIARQAPVASDLRQVVSAMRITADLERMGDLAAHIAKVARMRYPEHAVPDELRSTFAEMTTVASRMARSAAEAIRDRNVALCDEIRDTDETMNALHRAMFAVILEPGWQGTVEQGIDLALLGRYYERFADHAVLIAAHVAFLVSGDYNRLTPPR